MTEEWRPLAKALADQLADKGVLTDPRWRAAFENTPRHVFVPIWYRTPDTPVREGQDDWLEATYRDASLVTRHARVPGAEELLWPTSSSTMPSLMSRMLHLLDVRDGHRVLEIGTGTGYNAALLSYRVGSERVASVDFDPELVDKARSVLDSLGYQPHLRVGDGADGLADLAPYDRIIATASVPGVPPAWIVQLTEDGLIVTDIRGELSSNLIVLRKVGPEAVEGRFLAVPGHFMWCRREVGNPLRDGGSFNRVYDATDPRHLTTEVDPKTLDEPGARLLLQQLHYRDLTAWTTDEDGRPLLCLRIDDRSWADATLAGPVYEITQGGPTDIWGIVEKAMVQWRDLGCPAAERFGLTATTSSQTLWLDTPDNVIGSHLSCWIHRLIG